MSTRSDKHSLFVSEAHKERGIAVSGAQNGGFALLLVLLGIAGLVTLGAYTFLNSTGFKMFTNSNRQLELVLEEPDVVLASEYENPLADETQYENPFEDEPNPFSDF